MAKRKPVKEPAPISISLSEKDKETVTAADVLKKMDKLSFYIKKAEARLGKHERTLAHLIDLNVKEKDLVKAGLKLYGVKDEEAHI